MIMLVKTFRHQKLEERAEKFGGKLNLDGEYEWDKPEGREVWQIGCPILGESTESPLHIYVEMDENKGYIQCEQMKMLDLRVRGYKIIDRVKMADVINVTDAIQSIFDYI